MKTPGLLNWMLLILLGLIWGASFMGVSYALQGFGPITIAAIRVAIAAVIITLASHVIGHGLPAFGTATGRRTWAFAAGMALFSNAIPFSLLGWGQQHVSSGYAGVTMAVAPLLVLPLSHFLIPGERMSGRKALGFFIGFIGVVILIGPAEILQSKGTEAEALARVACVLAACCYAIGSVLTRLSPETPLLAFSSAALLVAALVLVPVALLAEGLPRDIPAQAWGGVLYLGIFPTALATILLVHIINSAGPPFMSLVNYQVPVWAVVFGMVFLGESLPGQFIWALGLILAGLAISQTGRRRAARAA